MEVRRHRPGISLDIPRELGSDQLGKLGLSIGAVLVVIASTSHCLDIPQRKGISGLQLGDFLVQSQESPTFCNFDSQMVTSGQCAH